MCTRINQVTGYEGVNLSRAVQNGNETGQQL